MDVGVPAAGGVEEGGLLGDVVLRKGLSGVGHVVDMMERLSPDFGYWRDSHKWAVYL